MKRRGKRRGDERAYSTQTSSADALSLSAFMPWLEERKRRKGRRGGGKDISGRRSAVNQGKKERGRRRKTLLGIESPFGPCVGPHRFVATRLKTKVSGGQRQLITVL